MKTYLIDLDGTMYHGTKIIESAKKWLDYLIANNQPFAFLTNNSSRTPLQMCQHMLDMGYTGIKPEYFYSSAQACADYLIANYPLSKLMVIGEDGMFEALNNNGFEIVNDSEKLVDFVIVGLQRDANYQTYCQAIKHLVKGARLIGTNNDRILPSENGPCVGNGSIVSLFEYAINQPSIHIGKPYSPILQGAMEHFKLSKDEIILVGDNLETDIALGANNQVETLLTLTGVHQISDITRLGIKPDHVVNNLTELIKKER